MLCSELGDSAGNIELVLISVPFKIQAMIAEETEKEKAKRKKSPCEMSPEELIELRTRDPDAWDAFVAANSVSSFGLAKPTNEDQARANKLLAKNQTRCGSWRSTDGSFSNSEDDHHRPHKQHHRGVARGRVHFDPHVDVVTVPVGVDFYESEQKTHSLALLVPAKRPQ